MNEVEFKEVVCRDKLGIYRIGRQIKERVHLIFSSEESKPTSSFGRSVILDNWIEALGYELVSMSTLGEVRGNEVSFGGINPKVILLVGMQSTRIISETDRFESIFGYIFKVRGSDRVYVPIYPISVCNSRTEIQTSNLRLLGHLKNRYLC